MSGYLHGQAALDALPDDHRLHVQLSMFFYGSTLKRLRQDLLQNRTGFAVVEVAAPINAPTLQVVLDRRSAYLIAFRTLGQPEWWGFVDDGCPASLPGGPVRRINGHSTYTWLGLPPSINMTPVRLLTGLAAFDGTVDPETARMLVLLLFLIPESLRFDDVWMECERYSAIGTRFAHTIHPQRFAGTVQNWAASGSASANVLLPYLA